MIYRNIDLIFSRISIIQCEHNVINIINYHAFSVLLATFPNHHELIISRYLNSEDYEGGFEMQDIEQLLSAMEANFHAWASAFAPIAMAGKDPLLIEKLERSLMKMKPEVALAVAKLIFLGDNRHVLEHVDTPCTIVTTTNDLVVPPSVPYYMQKKMTKIKSEVEIIDVDGHFPHLTAHNELLGVLGRALD